MWTSSNLFLRLDIQLILNILPSWILTKFHVSCKHVSLGRAQVSCKLYSMQIESHCLKVFLSYPVYHEVYIWIDKEVKQCPGCAVTHCVARRIVGGCGCHRIGFRASDSCVDWPLVTCSRDSARYRFGGNIGESLPSCSHLLSSCVSHMGHSSSNSLWFSFASF